MALVCRGCLLHWPTVPARHQTAMAKAKVTSLICETRPSQVHVGKAASAGEAGQAFETLLLLCAEDDSVVEMLREWFATSCES